MVYSNPPHPHALLPLNNKPHFHFTLVLALQMGLVGGVPHLPTDPHADIHAARLTAAAAAAQTEAQAAAAHREEADAHLTEQIRTLEDQMSANQKCVYCLLMLLLLMMWLLFCSFLPCLSLLYIF